MIRANDSVARRTEKKIEYQSNVNELDDIAYEELFEFISLEDQVLLPIVDTLGYIFKIHKQAIFSVFQTNVHPFFQQVIKEAEDDAALLMNAICIYLDIIEFIVPEGKIYVNDMLNIVLKSAVDNDSRLRQCCIFGIGIIAEKYPDFILPQTNKCLQIVLESFNNSKNNVEEYGLCYENAISTIYRFLTVLEPLKNSEEIWNIWFSSLPLSRDETEAMVNHRCLVELYQKGSPFVTGPAKIKHTIEIMISALLDTEDCDGDVTLLSDDLTKDAIKAILKDLTKTELQLLQNIISQLNIENQQKLQTLLLFFFI